MTVLTSLATQMVIPPADSIPGSGGSPGEVGTHSSVLAWRTPWAEEAGGLQSPGSPGVGYD